MLEHIEFAGMHSGDAAMVLPPHTLSKSVIETIRAYTHAMARELKVIGLMNVQYAVKGEKVFVLEVNPRASRTVPFVSKAIGFPLAKLAAKVMAGKTLKELKFTEEIWTKYWAVKESVFPFNRFHWPGHFALAGNAFDRRSHGPGCRSGHRLREIADGRELAAAIAWQNFHQRQRRAQKGNCGQSQSHFPTWVLKLSRPSGTAAVLEKAGLKVQRILKLLEGRPERD